LSHASEIQPSFSAASLCSISGLSAGSTVNDLFVACMPRLRKMAERLLRNREDSEDALQDALLSGFQNIHQFECRARFSTWMHTILRNSARSMWRKQRCRPIGFSVDLQSYEDEHPNFAGDFIERSLDPEEECLRRETTRLVEELLADLPPKYREVVRLCKIEELKITDAADHLGVPAGTIKARMHRARRMIQKHMNEKKGENPQRIRPDGVPDAAGYSESSSAETAAFRRTEIPRTRRVRSRRTRPQPSEMFSSARRNTRQASAPCPP
jgi:RNA polymerase sigma-70 factor, ECF subfamily